MRTFTNGEVKSTFASLASLLILVPAVCCSGKTSGHKLSRKQLPVHSEDWMILGSHGLMLTHYQTGPKHVNGIPVISRRDSDIPLFSSTLTGLTSSQDDFLDWDSDLVTDLKSAPLQSATSRDVVTRSGLVHITRNSQGKDAVRIEASSLLKKPLTLSPYTSNKIAKRFTQGAIIQTKITWYTGHDLLNPYCAQKSGWTPTDSSLIIAVTQEWKMRPKCGDFFELVVVDKNVGQVGKSVIARVVDLCGGCAPQVAHADLSKAAFTRLFNLDVGVVSGLAMRKVAPPKKWNVALYGPRIL
ncbi:hypothetical protein PtA15_14A213 [Puccinia triticina]|uniref:RlpA-like protein double-psi beta-barrel domain-containing protein n=1 Tax=Puccinia triticina TaxID=208348 RepID=A0ABY7D271_9BASI|nr:uncharacterized protein PtA15_14A213 [Puccinia triticina]WAQ91330.1 hypothetical protein PtA15_14A213 [Puccinia triticina]WAR62134.1 hypothetical protein PtB15_14B228 [Puccinia triticina]